MACFNFFGKYPIFRQMSNIFVSSSIAGSGRFFRAMYGMVSSLGLVLFLSDWSEWSEVLFHGFSPRIDLCFVFMVEVYVGVGSMDLGQLGGEGVGGFLL